MSAMFPTISTLFAPNAFSAGQHYGRLARERIAHSIKAYQALFANCGLGWNEACQKALAFEPMMTELDPHSMQEMQGIADGSGFDFQSILALNCRSELLSADFLNTQAIGQTPAYVPDVNECTSVAAQPRASATGETWLAQNWDWMGGQREALVLLEGRGKAGRFMTLTEAGMLAKIGLNEAGFAVGLNIIRSVNDGIKPGIAVHWLLRHLLGCSTVEQAHRTIDQLASRYGFGGSSNIICADASGVVASFELCATIGKATGFGRIEPDTDGIVRHTNHFLAPHLQPFQAEAARSLSTDWRLQSAQSLLGLEKAVDFEGLCAFLRNDAGGAEGDNPLLAICRSPDFSLPELQRVETVAGVVINTTRRQFWVAPNIPNRTEFIQVWSD
jgi:isopenicillin-N N-acyltransferase like protein